MTDEKKPTLQKEKERWENETVAPAIKKFPELKTYFTTSSGLPVERVYIPTYEDPSYMKKLGFPGEFPFTRGVQPTMYRGRLWTMRQYAGFSTAEEANKRNRYLLEKGATGLSVAFDLPTQIGYDSDDSVSRGEVGRVGVAIDTVHDMERLFDGIPLDKVSTSMTINATALVLLAMYIAVAEKQGVPLSALTGTIQNDILKEYFARGTYRFPPKPSLRLISDVFAFCGEHIPKWNTISISGYHIREAGSTAAQEIGFTLADAICYIETALKAGMKIDEFAPQLAFFFASHTDMLEEVAKFRAARRLYSRIMKERFGAKDPKSMMLRFHTQTGGVTLTAQQPDNNVVRVTLQALAAVLGGTQSLHTNSKDEALALPTESSVKLSLRTQQIIALESGVTSTIDPLGGSYYIEELTDRLEAEAEKIIQNIDDMGGMVSAIERGYPHREIEHAAYAYGKSVESGEHPIVGVNKFVEEASAKVPLFSVPEGTEKRQIESLALVKKERDNKKVAEALALVEKTARGTENLMPVILDAVRAEASLGEICNALQKVFGEYTESFV
ncbi:MAG: methylmalonyl-CoA mutase family protein [Candidatus Paceibacterota bacterium]|jgi:methylmalonyl-CoA mutase N-terminal domain/subunit